ncbi:MAG: hypothetical protein BMS9Abin30_0747 [Gammaproteobacteria bacterium]|nr:MAG: hypothetical protein BMS9Abin30_0747 [Gammaproteobacteria bacterium]
MVFPCAGELPVLKRYPPLVDLGHSATIDEISEIHIQLIDICHTRFYIVGVVLEFGSGFVNSWIQV